MNQDRWRTRDRLGHEARLVYESLIHGEDFEDFQRRLPTSQDDLEIWRILDRRFGDDYPLVRERWLQAGEARRCKQVTLEDYLLLLETSSRFSRPELAAMAGVSELEWIRWTQAQDDVIPPPAQLERLIACTSLSEQEARHLRQLREATVKAAQPPRRPGLAEYLQTESRFLGLALAKIRGRKGFSIDQVARQAGIPALLWQRWEEGLDLPALVELDDVLKRLHWVWATDDALRGFQEEVPPPRDAKLWKAFLNDHEWEETDSQECWLLPKDPTPEAVAAWREVQLAQENGVGTDPQRATLTCLAERRESAESSLGSFLRYRREAKCEGVEEMALKAGVAVATWLAWESGEAVPGLSELQMVAARIFVTPWLRERALEVWHSMELSSDVDGESTELG